MSYPQQTYPNFSELFNYINTAWITNGMEEITGIVGNNVVNALLTFITQSPLNWQSAAIFSTGGAISPTRPVNVFTGVTPTLISWSGNIYNQYIFINSTNDNIPSGTYYDINLQPVNIIPAKSIVNIVKANNSIWVVGSVPSSGSGTGGKSPLIGVVDGGGANDPVSGLGTFKSNLLIGLGANNNGHIQIVVDDVLSSNFGLNSSFTFDNAIGLITWTNGNTWFTGSGLYIDLNQ